MILDKISKYRINNIRNIFLLILLVLTIFYFSYYKYASLITRTENDYKIDYDLKKIANIKGISLKKINRNEGFQRWIIVTSINKPTEQIKKLANIDGFKLIVVGDKKTDPNWSYNNTVFLNIDKQKGLNYKIFETIPFNSYNRKNIGYLYAIQNGANYIYDTDDDNAPIVDLEKYFKFENYDTGLVFNQDQDSPSVLNPYAHFGQPTIWPRGYPLSAIQKTHYNNYICTERKVSYVQQGVVNGDPDVDAIFRLTKSMNYKRINISFDETSPSIQYPIYTLSPYNSQNTFFHYEAFWSLYLPITVSFRLTDIWRSYWSQRLLWLIDGTVTFNGPNAVQFRNSHSFLKDFEEEKAMYSKTESLIKFLYEWRCLKEKFYECVIDLSENMAKEKFWEYEEVDSIKNWLDDLNKIGYKEPKIVNFENMKNFTMETKPKNSNITYFPVRYTPRFQKGIDFDNYCCEGQTMNVYDNYESLKFLDSFCMRSNHKLNYNSQHFELKTNDANLILIITFNFEPKPDNILVLHHIYRNFFKNIIFCAKDIINVLNQTRTNNFKFDAFTFIDLELNRGYFHFDCMAKAYEMNFVTEGFLLMSDDILLRHWKLKNYDLSKMWYVEKPVCRFEVRKEMIGSHWNCWVIYFLNLTKYLNYKLLFLRLIVCA